MSITYLEYEEPDEYFSEENELLNWNTPPEYYKEPLIDLFHMEDYQLLKIKRICDGFNQTELSNILGIGTSTLSEIETGKRSIPYKHFKRMRSYIYDELYENKEFKEYFER